jgi:hypothetical protein
MGLFDNIRCAMVPDGEYQTKDTPSQFLDNYEIRADGSLWVEIYDVVDRSNPNDRSMAGCMTRENAKWQRCREFAGSIEFYDDAKTYIAFMVNGEAIQIREIIEGTSNEVWKRP